MFTVPGVEWPPKSTFSDANGSVQAFRGWINRDQVIAHFRVQQLSIRSGEEHLRFLDGHVTVNAIGGNLLTELRKLATLLCLMAGQASRRECSCVTLRGVRVMARRTS